MPLKNPEVRAEYLKKYRMQNKQKRLAYNKAYYAQNREEHLSQTRAWYQANKQATWVSRAFKVAEKRAVERELPFELHEVSLPVACPCCDVVLEIGGGRNSPSLDRIQPLLGYVPGNVWVICLRCNAIKNDATPDELRRIADRIESFGLHDGRGNSRQEGRVIQSGEHSALRDIPSRANRGSNRGD